MTHVRRIAIGVIVFAAVVTLLLGGLFIYVAADYSADHRFDLWLALAAIGSIAGIVAGAGSAYFAARDLPRASLSQRARYWTWAATAAFSLLAFVSVWWMLLAVIGPLVTALFVRLSRGPAAPAAQHAA